MIISVIVPAYNAPDLLAVCLAALGRQTRPPDEILVVDDGSPESLQAVAAQSGARCVRQAHAGPAVARNRGAREARGDLLLFTDTDCAPAADWVEQMARVFENPEVAGARGAYRTRQRALVARFVQQEYQDKYDRLKPGTAIDFVDTYSAGYRRRVFLENGGFEEAFPVPSVEDQEFSFRLAQKGYRLVFVPQAVVYHQHDQTWPEYLRRKFWIGYWKFFLLRWHPDKVWADSHTPLAQRAQLGLLGLWGVLVLAGLFVPPLLWGALLAGTLFILSAASFLYKLLRRDAGVLLVAPLLLLGRAGALGIGLLAGFIGLRAHALPRRASLSGGTLLLKRLLDIVVASVAVGLSAPGVVMLAILVKLDSPGPAFFVQERVGLNGHRFRMFKLRSMIAGADKLEGQAKSRQDQRVTRMGRFLRRWSLDELPQFWNILMGHMSLVGPRPEAVNVVAQYSDWHRQRLAVKPGLTGPMQVNGRGDLSLDERVHLELDYIEHYSLKRDIVILLQTIPAVLSGRGAY